MTELVTRGMLGIVAGNMSEPTTLRYSYVPPASPTLTTSLAGAEFDSSDKTSFIMWWKVGGLYQWETEIRGLGLSPWWVKGVSGFGNIPFGKDEDMVKHTDVQEWFIGCKVSSTYLNDSMLNKIFTIGLELFVTESLTVGDETSFSAGQFGFEHDVNLTSQWLKHLLDPLNFPSKFVEFLESQKR